MSKLILSSFQKSLMETTADKNVAQSLWVATKTSELLFRYKKHVLDLAGKIQKPAPFVCRATEEPPHWFFLLRASVVGGAGATFSSGYTLIWSRNVAKKAKEAEIEAAELTLQRHNEVLDKILEQKEVLETLKDMMTDVKATKSAWWKIW